MADGHLGKCIPCTKLDATKHRSENLDRIQKYDHNRNGNPSRKAAKIAYQVRYRQERREAYLAHNAVNNAIRDGKLTRQPCEKCGATKVDAHHTDYSKPLDVTWLCVKCHHAEHRKYDYEAIANSHPEIKVAQAA